MADVPLGRNYLAVVPVVDGNGNAITTGLTLTADLYGPLSATAQQTGQALAYWGDGWGYLVPGAQHAVSGTYTLRIASAAGANNPGDLVGQARVYVVGLAQPGVRTLRDILVDLTLALTDGVQSRTTALGTFTTFADARWALGQANELAGTEVYFLDRTNPFVADTNPVVVMTSTSAGVVTFTPATTAAVPAGTPYLIGGTKYPHATKLAAIRQVLEDLGPLELTSDRVTITAVLNQYEYDVPVPFQTLKRVYRQSQVSTIPTLWYELGRGVRWDYLPDRRKLVFTPGAELAMQRFRLEGTVEAALPQRLTDYVPVRAATVVRLAEVYLKARGGDAEERRGAAFLYQDLLRKGRVASRAGRPV